MVPSKNRAEATTTEGTLSWLPASGVRYSVIVEPQDEQAYRDAGVENLQVLPENDKGLGYALQNAEFDTQYLFKCDDDVTSFCRLGGVAGTTAPERFQSTVSHSLLFLDMGFDCVAFEYANQIRYAGLKKMRVNPRLKTNYIVDRKFFAPRADISTYEDFWATHVLRSRGGKSVLNNVYFPRFLASEVFIAGTPGGLQDFDRAAMGDKEIEIFTALGYGVVHKPDRPWKKEPKLKQVGMEA